MRNNLYQIACERQAEMRDEAKFMRNSQKVKTGNPAQARRMLSMIPAFVVFIMALVKFLR